MILSKAIYTYTQDSANYQINCTVIRIVTIRAMGKLNHGFSPHQVLFLQGSSYKLYTNTKQSTPCDPINIPP